MVAPVRTESGQPGAWNHRYLFVNFSTAEEAEAAAKARTVRKPGLSRSVSCQRRVQVLGRLTSEKPGEKSSTECGEDLL